MSIVDVAAEEAERRGAAGVNAVHLKLGPLAGVITEAMRSAWELAREGTPLSEARLVIEEVPIVAYCTACRADRRVRSIQEMCCGECGQPTPDIVAGRELEITAMEIREPETRRSGVHDAPPQRSEVKSQSARVEP